MKEGASYRTILRSSSIMGAASVVNILSGLAKMKAAALLLGPAGVGLIGLYQNLMQTGATLAALGLGSVGTRQMAEAVAEGSEEAVVVRRALFLGSLALAVLGGLLFWLLSGWIASGIVRAPERSSDVAWLSIGVALAVFAGAQGALLTGLRRIGDMARVQLLSGLVAALLGIAAIALWGMRGVPAMVLALPAATVLIGGFFVARIQSSSATRPPLSALLPQWRRMAALGSAFMLSGLVTILGQLVVRALVQRNLGDGALGQFQASWAIGMTYLTFVLGAMTADYYPRLTATITDHGAACRLVNEQTEVALLLCAPVLLAMLGLAPWVVRLLYSDAFGPAVGVLRWQILGDLLKVMSWPLGYLLLALGAGRSFILAEGIGIGMFIAATALLLPLLGVTATGVAFLAMYSVYLPAVWLMARQRIGFRWGRAVLAIAVAVAVAAIALAVAALFSDLLAGVLGLLLSLGFGFYALLRLAGVAGYGGRIGRIAEQVQHMLHRLGFSS